MPNDADNRLLIVITSLIIIFVAWTHFATLDEVTRGDGRVIPSSNVQVVQNLEGGIVEEIRIKAGDVVHKGDILVKIDDTGFASSFDEQRQKYFSLKARIARLEGELADKAPLFDAELMAEGQEFVQSETALANARKEQFFSQISILKRQIEEQEQNLQENRRLRENSEKKIQLLQEELKLTKPLAEQNIVPQIEILRLEREINDTRAELDQSSFAIIKAQNSKSEAGDRVDEKIGSYKTDILAELASAREEFKRLKSTMVSAQDRVDRTDVRSPVKGTVKRVLVSTIGGVIKPGMDIVEVVPFEDTLLIEAKIKPQDIAFLRPNQEAKVRLSAYDFSIYGGLDAQLEQISADAITDDEGQSFYQIRVRTDKSYLGTEEKPLPIMPGMVAEVDILTGKKTVWQYLMKPILKAKQKALTER